MNKKLIDGLLDYFILNKWKPSKGLNKVYPFKKWGEKELQDHILALVKVGILEKKEGTTTLNTLYRLESHRAHFWKDKLELILRDAPIEPTLDFRTVYILYVIGTFYLQHQRPPRQSELYFSDAPGHHGGLINDWLVSSGADAEDPHIAGAPHIRRATLKLAELGYMVERGSPGKPQPYLLTDKGLELVRRLQQTHWRDWPVFHR